MSVTIADEPTLGVAQRPLRRAAHGAFLGGVCAGLAVRFGVRARSVRVLFTLATLVAGFGLVLYVALWALLTRSGEETSAAQRLAAPRRELTVLLAQVVVIAAVVALVSSAALRGTAAVVGSLALSAAGLLVVWRGASVEERAQLEELRRAAPGLSQVSLRSRRAWLWRLVPGLVLVLIGLRILNHLGGVWSVAVPVLVGTAVLLVGLLILLAPWWLQTVHDLTEERRQRVRSEERADLARRVHDSVLQTLTLVERHASDPGEVRRLTRAAERDLRRWLFEPDGAAREGTLSARLAQLQEEVEKDYRVRVELVSVGDTALDERLDGLCLAAREALVNAAKWSGCDSVALYGEVEADQVSIYVRDTGRGFDPDEVSPDRRGLAHSVRERCERLGGRAEIRSSPGQGAEVALHLPRVAP